MSMYGALRAARRIADWPMLRPSRTRWEERQFLDPQSGAAYFGVYASFAQARSHLPRGPGFNLGALAREHVQVRMTRVFEYDYPIMRWLERAFARGAARVLDIGGSVGVHYFAYRRYLDMPESLAWHVVEVPEIAAVGRGLARQHGAPALMFTSDLEAAVRTGGHDVWNCAGAIQYVEDAHPARLLDLCETPPEHLLLNKLPLYGGEDFVTTQNLGEGAFSPMHVYNTGAFIRAIEERGYVLEDKWDVYERALHIPGRPERSFPCFTGLYFARLSDAAG